MSDASVLEGSNSSCFHVDHGVSAANCYVRTPVTCCCLCSVSHPQSPTTSESTINSSAGGSPQSPKFLEALPILSRSSAFKLPVVAAGNCFGCRRMTLPAIKKHPQKAQSQFRVFPAATLLGPDQNQTCSTAKVRKGVALGFCSKSMTNEESATAHRRKLQRFQQKSSRTKTSTHSAEEIPDSGAIALKSRKSLARSGLSSVSSPAGDTHKHLTLPESVPSSHLGLSLSIDESKGVATRSGKAATKGAPQARALSGRGRAYAGVISHAALRSGQWDRNDALAGVVVALQSLQAKMHNTPQSKTGGTVDCKTLNYAKDQVSPSTCNAGRYDLQTQNIQGICADMALLSPPVPSVNIGVDSKKELICLQGAAPAC